MMFISRESVNPRHFLNHEGESRIIRDFYGGKDLPGPQGFLVEMPPDSTAQAHFHETDQFQVFFADHGATFKRHTMWPTTLHYSDAYTTYGPFTSGGGLEFFTLRPTASSVAAFMPGSRDQLIGTPGRNLEVDGFPTRARVLDKRAVHIQSIIEPHADGLAALLLEAGPGAAIQAPNLASTVGQYYCVIAGAVSSHGSVYTERALAWVPPGQDPPSLLPDREVGFAVLLLQFPAPGKRSVGSPP